VYGDAGAYGGLAGFSGPALDGESAPVVRYQDLMRTSAPASAGVPEFGRLINDASDGFGAEPLPLPVEQAMMMGSYGAPMAFPDTDGQYAYTIDPSTQPYAVVITKAPAGAKTGPVPAGTRAYDAIVAQAKAYNPYWFTSSPSAPSTERETAARADQAENSVVSKVGAVASDFFTGFGIRSGYIPSGRDEAPKQEVSKDGSQTGTDWGKVALIGGGVLVGVTSLVLITRALTSKE
jgi:hypothetical protein